MEMVRDSEVLPSWTFCNAAAPVLASTSSKAAKPFLFSHSLDLLEHKERSKLLQSSNQSNMVNTSANCSENSAYFFV